MQTEIKKEWAIKIEDLDYNELYASQIENTLKSFIKDNFDFLDESITPISCRTVSGFIPYSNNKGGFNADAYISQLDGYFNSPSGFDEYDNTCLKTYEYKVKTICIEHNLTLAQWNEGLDNDDHNMIQLREDVEMSYCSDYDSSKIEFMLKLEDENTLYVYFGIGGSDAPYFRNLESNFDFEIKFNDIFELRKKLNDLLNDDNVKLIQSMF
jgi:hypothetical protein